LCKKTFTAFSGKIKRILFGVASRQMTAEGLFTQPRNIFQIADFVRVASKNEQNQRFEKFYGQPHTFCSARAAP
jgi:hypothetical protein